VKKHIFLFTFLLHVLLAGWLNLVSAQTLYLKSPIADAVFHTQTDSVKFVWKNITGGSPYTLEYANNPSFTGATSIPVAQNRIVLSATVLPSTTYWRVQSNNSQTSATRSIQFVNPASLGNLVYHINAQEGVTSVNGKVSAWNNLVGSQYNATQGNNNQRPDLVENGLLGNDIVRFGGNSGSTSTRMQLDEFLLVDTNLCLISVHRQLALNSANSFLLGKNGGGVNTGGTNSGGRNFGIINGAPNNIEISGATHLNWGVRTAYYNRIYQNKSLAPSTGQVDRVQFNTIGLRPDNTSLNFFGFLAELFIYNTSLSESNRLLVENYLITKYTPFPDLGEDRDICGEQIKIGIRPDHGYSNITWSTGAVNTDSILITQNGTYWVRVTSFGVTLSDTIRLSGVVPKPQINMGGTSNICFGDSILLYRTSPVPPGYTAQWSNGSTADSIFVDTQGQYSLVYSDSNNCQAASLPVYVAVDSFSVLSGLGPDRNICLGTEIFFENSSSGNGPYTYLWSTGSTNNFTEVVNLGANELFIEATSFFGCISRDTAIITLLNVAAPEMNFTFDTVCPFSPAQFSDVSVASPGDAIVNWEWIFPDANAGNQNPIYNYGNTGSYQVTLSVETSSECKNSVTKTIVQHKQPNAKYDFPIACAQSPALFTSTSTVALPDALSSFTWKYDGNIQTGFSTNFTFPTDGLYKVELVVTSDKGCRDSISRQIEIFPALVPDFTYENYCAGDSVSFMDATPSFSIVEWLWSFGLPNAFSFEQNPKQRYNNSGFYTVNLKVTNAIGCESTVSKIIDVKAPPLASIGNDSACLDDELFVFSTSQLNNDPVVSYVWTLNGDTLSFVTDSLLLMFDELGTYEVAMYIQTESGCEADATKTITVYEKPTASFRLNPTYGVSPQPVQFTNLSQDASSYFWDFGDGTGESNAVNPIYTYLTNGVYTIVLQAINENGCSDFFSREIPVIPSELDIELRNLQLSTQLQPDGSLKIQPTVQLVNVGTRVIENAELHLRLDGQVDIVESWSGNIPTAGIAVYTFSTFYSVSAGYDARYVCVEAKNVNDGSEENLSNNRACKVLKEQIQIVNPYPNPATNLVNIDLIVESDGNATLVLYEVSGKKVMEIPKYPLERGLNKIQLDLRNVFSGEYYLKISYLNDDYVKPLVISNK
jgi:PKD repeat protein